LAEKVALALCCLAIIGGRWAKPLGGWSLTL
jgi:hypothetical protein